MQLRSAVAIAAIKLAFFVVHGLHSQFDLDFHLVV